VEEKEKKLIGALSLNLSDDALSSSLSSPRGRSVSSSPRVQAVRNSVAGGETEFQLECQKTKLQEERERQKRSWLGTRQVDANANKPTDGTPPTTELEDEKNEKDKKKKARMKKKSNSSRLTRRSMIPMSSKTYTPVGRGGTGPTASGVLPARASTNFRTRLHTTSKKQLKHLSGKGKKGGSSYLFDQPTSLSKRIEETKEIKKFLAVEREKKERLLNALQTQSENQKEQIVTLRELYDKEQNSPHGSAECKISENCDKEKILAGLEAQFEQQSRSIETLLRFFEQGPQDANVGPEQAKKKKKKHHKKDMKKRSKTVSLGTERDKRLTASTPSEVSSNWVFSGSSIPSSSGPASLPASSSDLSVSSDSDLQLQVGSLRDENELLMNSLKEKDCKIVSLSAQLTTSHELNTALKQEVETLKKLLQLMSRDTKFCFPVTTHANAQKPQRQEPQPQQQQQDHALKRSQQETENQEDFKEKDQGLEPQQQELSKDSVDTSVDSEESDSQLEDQQQQTLNSELTDLISETNENSLIDEKSRGYKIGNRKFGETKRKHAFYTPHEQSTPKLTMEEIVEKWKNLEEDEVRQVHRCQAYIRRYLAKKLRTKLMIGKELLITEQNYINILNTILYVFMYPLEQKNILTAEQINLIFPDIEKICQHHRRFVVQIENVVGDWEKFKDEGIANVFIHEAEFLKIYSKYINNFDAAMSLVDKLKKENPQFQEFLNAAEAKPECNFNDLNSFMINPIQRIPRYAILLRDLHKHTSMGDKTFGSICEAIEKIQTIANYLNEQKRIYENNITLRHLDTLICCKCESGPGVALTSNPTRMFQKSGTVTFVNKAKHYKKKYLFLFSDIFLITQAKESSTNEGQEWYLAEHIYRTANLQQMSAWHDHTINRTVQYSFCVKFQPNIIYYFMVPTKEERDAWVNAFQKLYVDLRM